MARRLVTVRQVGAIKSIEGAADRIEVAVIDGWSCIVGKDQFHLGELGVFFEIDSFLPGDDPRWSFLEKSFIRWNDRRGFRVKSIKMRGHISQGLLEPIDNFPEISEIIAELGQLHSEEQVVQKVRDIPFEDRLGVVKWEAMENTISQASKATTTPFPSFLCRTDQERVQNLPNVFDDWKDALFQETTKMDGSSMTAYFLRRGSSKIDLLPKLDDGMEQAAKCSNGRFGLCSRTIDLMEHDVNGQKFWEVAKRNDLATKLSELNRNIALQGELCGSTIQGNFEGFPKGVHDFFLFSVWDIDKQAYETPRDAEGIAKKLGIKHVPVHGYFPLCDIASNINELLARAEGKGLHGKKREGIVLKHVDGAISFKVISNSYLLKHGG